MERACVHRSSESFSNAAMWKCSHFHLILRISLSLQIFQDWNIIVLNTFGSDIMFSNIFLDSGSRSWAVKLKTTHHNNFHRYANINKIQSKFESEVFDIFFFLFQLNADYILNTCIYHLLPPTCFGVCYTIFRETIALFV
jgi:hypothetical protein